RRADEGLYFFSEATAKAPLTPTLSRKRERGFVAAGSLLLHQGLTPPPPHFRVSPRRSRSVQTRSRFQSRPAAGPAGFRRIDGGLAGGAGGDGGDLVRLERADRSGALRRGARAPGGRGGRGHRLPDDGPVAARPRRVLQRLRQPRAVAAAAFPTRPGRPRPRGLPGLPAGQRAVRGLPGAAAACRRRRLDPRLPPDPAGQAAPPARGDLQAGLLPARADAVVGPAGGAAAPRAAVREPVLARPD